MSDRIVYDGPSDDHLHEIVLTRVSIHLERTSQHDWHAIIWRDGYQCLDLHVENLSVIEQIGLSGLVRHDAPLPGCDVRWGHHRCENDLKDHDDSHVCDCGALPLTWKDVAPPPGHDIPTNDPAKTWPWPAKWSNR